MRGGKHQRQKAHQKSIERSHLRRSSFERFGRHIVKSIMEDYSFSIDIDSIDWDGKIKRYLKYQNHGLSRSVPGLMYINWVVSKEFDQDPYIVRTVRTRHRKYIYPKHATMYLAVTLYRYEYEPLLEFYDMKNHATIVSALDNVRDLMFSDKNFNEKIQICTDKLLGYGANNENANERSDTTGSFGSIQDPEIKEGDSMLVNRDREIESSD